jgi:L-amino acid N-acyltransferase YncA
MSKVVRIKQSDIEKIVENIVSGQVDQENSIAKEEDVTENKRNDQFMVAKSNDGKFAVINIKTGKVLGIK